MIKISTNSTLSDIAYNFQQANTADIYVVIDDRLHIYRTINDIPTNILFDRSETNINGHIWYYGSDGVKKYCFFDKRALSILRVAPQPVHNDIIGKALNISSSSGSPVPTTRLRFSLNS